MNKKEYFCSTMKMLRIFALFLLLAAAAVTVGASELTELLAALPGVEQVVPLESSDGVEKCVLMLRQPLDHRRAGGASFSQRIVVRHRGWQCPTVLVTEGYDNNYGLHPSYREELTELLDGNTVEVEHRFFGASTPFPSTPSDGDGSADDALWDFLTVRQSADDYHTVRTLLGTLYTGPWFSTGISKGGQTALFYRTWYPHDVVANVSYVAPLNRGVEDGRHETFLQQVGDDGTRALLLAFQRRVLERRDSLLPRLDDYCRTKGYTFRRPLDEVLDLMVLEYPFAYWQWGLRPDAIPAADAGDDALFAALMEQCEPNYFSQQTKYMPFNVQALRELGYYGYDCRPLADLLARPDYEDYLRRTMVTERLGTIRFSRALYRRCRRFLRHTDYPALFIYGECDPWSASRVVLPDGKREAHVYIQPGGSHRTRIATLPADMQQEIRKLLNDWAR